VRSATQALTGQDPTASSPESSELVLDRLGGGRQTVGYVVDENQDFNAISDGQFTHAWLQAGGVTRNVSGQPAGRADAGRADAAFPAVGLSAGLGVEVMSLRGLHGSPLQTGRRAAPFRVEKG
jgi:hypothetical protein